MARTLTLPRIVITGMGAITPLGLSVDEYWQGLINGRSGIGPISLFDASAYPVKVAAEVKGFDPEQYMPLKRVDRSSRCIQFAIAAARMATEAARLDMSREQPEKVGVIIASNGMISLITDESEVLRQRGRKRAMHLIRRHRALQLDLAQLAFSRHADRQGAREADVGGGIEALGVLYRQTGAAHRTVKGAREVEM